VSHALARLRETFGDALLVRVGASLRPTTRGERLREPLAKLLGETEALLTGDLESFDPTKLVREFAIGGTDFFEALILPTLMARLARDAPGVSLVMRSPGDGVEHALFAREVDLAFGTRFRATAGIVVVPVAEMDLVVLARRHHPALTKRRLQSHRNRRHLPTIPLATYTTLPHILVAPRGGPGGAVDVALAQRGLSRTVVLRVEHFIVAAMTARDTDAIVTLPRAFAMGIARTLGLAVYEAPVEIPPFTFQFVHTLERENDPALSWLRAVVRDEFHRVIEKV
jgi:DNA-binding transcriptional LysR family regulator